MSRQIRTRILSLLVLLGALAAVLSAPAPKAYASPCCSSCADNDLNCWRWCDFDC
jgi:hypothetical protein